MITVQCKVCHKEMKQITNSHLRHHQLSPQQYKELFPGSELVPPELASERSERGHQINLNRIGVPRSQEVKDKVSRANKGRPAWNKGIPCSEEAKENLSRKAKARYEDEEFVHWNTGNTTPDEVKQKISQSLQGQTLSEEHKRKKREAEQAYRNSENFVPSMLGKKHSEETRQKISQSIKRVYVKIRNTMEEKNRWIKEEEVPAYTKYKRKVAYYTQKSLHKLPDYDGSKRGINDFSSDNYQIDHIYSVNDGFINNIEPIIIGHHANLRFIHWSENAKKSVKSDITIEELMKNIEEDLSSSIFESY